VNPVRVLPSPAAPPGVDDSVLISGLRTLQDHFRQTPSGAELAKLDPLGAAEMKRFHLLRKDVPEAYLTQFRQLRGRLAHRRVTEEAAGRSQHSVLVTSAGPGEGKTFVSLNLALMLAVAPESRVLWVDVHARRPAFDQGPGEGFERGIEDCLQGVPWTSATRQAPHMNLHLMSIARRQSGLDDPLDVDALARWLRQHRESFTWIVLDGPELGSGVDAELLAHAADATLLVARPGVTRFQSLDAGLRRLDRSKLAGVTFNGAD
jgi:Mrp family chromosome partitioning ATPase